MKIVTPVVECREILYRASFPGTVATIQQCYDQQIEC